MDERFLRAKYIGVPLPSRALDSCCTLCSRAFFLIYVVFHDELTNIPQRAAVPIFFFLRATTRSAVSSPQKKTRTRVTSVSYIL